MRVLLALVCAVVGSTAIAAFDLQQVSRYNSSAICRTWFDSVAPRADGQSFVVAGTVAEDVLLVEFDALGSVIRTQIWDSPLVEVESSPEVLCYADGRVLLRAGRFLVQFSPSLVKNWEIELPGNFKFALDGSDNAYTMISPVVTRYNAAGVSIGTTTLANFNGQAIKGFPGQTVSGFVAVGRDTAQNRPCVIRLNANMGQVFRATDTTGAVGTGATFLCADLEADGDAVLGGVSNSFKGVFGSLTTGGTFISSSPAALSTRVPQVVAAGSDYAVCSGTFGAIRIARSTGTVVGGFNGVTAGPVSYLSDSGRFAVVHSSPSIKLFDASFTEVQNVPTSTAMRAGTSVNSTLAAMVGQFDGSGTLALTNGDGIGVSDYRFVASPRRPIYESLSFGDGSVALLSMEQLAAGERLSIARYRSNGSLLYARSITSDPLAPTSPCAGGSTDGSISIAADAGGAWLFVRLNAAGAVVANQAVTDIYGFSPQAVEALPNGTSLVMGTEVSGRFAIYRMSASGQLLGRATFTDSATAFKVVATKIVGSSVFVAYQLNGGDIVLRLINPTTLASTADRFLGIANIGDSKVALDQNGAVVFAYCDAGFVFVERRNPTTLALVNGSSIGEGVSVKGLGVGPNGNTVCLIDQGAAADKLYYLGPANFPEVVSSTLAGNLAGADLAIDSTNYVYLSALEVNGTTENVYAARYLANGVRSAQRRTAGKPLSVHIAGGGVWVTGEVGTRKKGWGPFAARYSL